MVRQSFHIGVLPMRDCNCDVRPDHYRQARRYLAGPTSRPAPTGAQTSRIREGSFVCGGGSREPIPENGLQMPDERFHVYDTTLRDGAQQEGLTLTVADKLAIARRLDEFGVGYIEGGWPGAIPKDTEFFRRARTELELSHATLAAFGATRRPGAVAADDPQVAALRES